MQVAPEVDVTALGGASDGDNTAAAASSRSRSSSARFLTPFNMLLGPVTIDQARYAQAACKAHGNAAVANFSAGSLCLATGALSAGDDAATARSDMAYTKGGDTAAAQAVLDAAPFGIDPVFLAGSALYDGSVAAERYYASFERATVPVDAAAPAGPSIKSRDVYDIRYDDGDDEEMVYQEMRRYVDKSKKPTVIKIEN